MAILNIARLFTTLISLLILGAAGYLLWTWQQGDWVRDASGELLRVREDWRLWTGLALLGWSFAGRSLVLPLLARSDRRPSAPRREGGPILESPTGSRLYVEALGPEQAPPIIFTHGWGMDSTIWSYAKGDLSDRFRLVLWDLPGLGKSRGKIGLEAFAADLAHLVSLCGRQKPVLVGHSIGGMTVQTLLRDDPGLQDRLAGVVLLNTTHTNPLKTMLLSPLWSALQRPLLEPLAKLTIGLQPLAWLAAWQGYLSGSTHIALRLGFAGQVTRSQLDHAALLATRNPPGAQARGDLAMFRWDSGEAARMLRVPALVVGGEVDIVTLPQASHVLAAGKARLEIAPDANHMGFLEQFERYDDLIAAFTLAVQPSATRDLPARDQATAQTPATDPEAQLRPPAA